MAAIPALPGLLLLHSLACSQVQPPERVPPPVVRKPHARLIVRRELENHAQKPLEPARIGSDAFEQIAQNRERAEYLPVHHFKGIVPFQPFRNHGRIANDPVPQSAVMGADVAHGVDRHEPRVENFGAHAEVAGDTLPDLHRRAFVERDHHAEVHDVRERPVRWQVVRIAVCVVEVLGEGLSAPCARVSLPTLAHEPVVAIRIETEKIRAVEEAEGARLLDEEVGKLRTHIHLDAHNRIKHHLAKLPVEHVGFPHAIKRGALPELVRATLLVNVPVAAQAVVAHILEMADENIAVCDRAAVLHERVGLLFEREKRLRVLHGRKSLR